MCQQLSQLPLATHIEELTKELVHINSINGTHGEGKSLSSSMKKCKHSLITKKTLHFFGRQM